MSNINFSHPSVSRFKPLKPYTIISPFGSARFYNVSSFKPKYNLSLNGSIANKDTRINNFQEIDSNKPILSNLNSSFKSLDFPNNFMTPISQGANSSCALMSRLHQIQNQLDFPIDFNKFLECVPIDSIPNNMPDIAKIAYANEIDKFFKDPDLEDDSFWRNPEDAKTWFLKYLNLLFGGHCIPVSARLPIEKCKEGYVISANADSNKCDLECATSGIKLEVFLPNDPDDLPKDLPGYLDILEKYGPQMIEVEGDNMVKLWLVGQSGNNLSWDEVKDLDQDDLKEMLGDKWYSFVSNLWHNITLVNGSGPDSNGEYSFTFYNSWSGGSPNEFTIKWKSDKDFPLPPLDKPNQKWKSLENKLQIKVVPCKPNGVSPEQKDKCKEKNCTDLGYDKTLEDSSSDCPCECDTITNNRGVTITKIYSKVNGTWEYKCSCDDFSQEELAGGKFNPQQEYIDGCDVKCKNPDSKLPCSGYEESNTQALALYSMYNIYKVSSLSLL